MRIVLSRKGFDSSAGKVASPIFDDGAMISLPIPERGSGTTYGEVSTRRGGLGELVEQLTLGEVPHTHHVHLDPDLEAEARERAPGWRPLFGQVDAAQTVLARNGVGVGDLFLFFGWFREIEATARGLRYRRGAPDQHVLFGWLQVGAVLDPRRDAVPVWARSHPHVHVSERMNNTLYVASERLELPDGPVHAPDGSRQPTSGAGVFTHFRDALRLTARGASRSHWSLPAWFEPRDERPPLGYHDDSARWQRDGERVRLASVARGQEFVLDAAHYPEATGWLRELFAAR
jgi:hypothetical protein